MITHRSAAMAFFLALPLCAGAQVTQVDPPVTEHIDAHTDISVVPPTSTFFGTRGLSQTSSAEALGQGRLIFSYTGSWYKQDKVFPGTPSADANIFSGIAAAALGLNRQVDIFASISHFGTTNYPSDNGAGLGSIGAGIQGTLPFSPDTPIRMAAQVGIYQGLSKNTIDANGADGYDYFETRDGLDFHAKLIETLVLGNEAVGFKLHFNEGAVTSAQSGTDALLLLGAGAQVNLLTTVLGLELHSRSSFNDINPPLDPVWITPSVQFRTPFSLNVTLGGDISLSKDRDDAVNTRALEPYRLFGGLAFSFDTEYGERRAAKEKAQREALEKAELRNRNRGLKDDLAQSRVDDSLARAKQQAQMDSVAANARRDSLDRAAKATQDSLALAESQRKLADEKSKRSDMEKQLLSTGLLLLDAVYFETGKTDISINSKPYLNIIAKMLIKYPKLQIEIAGHTDDVGSDASNQRLSQGRAESVMRYMDEVAPDLKPMLTAKGYGESMPKADNKTAAGRKLNRRTELAVLNKEALKEYNP